VIAGRPKRAGTQEIVVVFRTPFDRATIGGLPPLRAALSPEGR
jgi:hypothetical protein